MIQKDEYIKARPIVAEYEEQLNVSLASSITC